MPPENCGQSGEEGLQKWSKEKKCSKKETNVEGAIGELEGQGSQCNPLQGSQLPRGHYW